jgi:predicted acyltransferase
MRWWTFPTVVLGSNAILAFVFSSIITSLNDTIHIQQAGGKSLSLHEFGYHLSSATGLSPTSASLAYAILIVLINIALITPFYYKKIFLKA